MAVPVPAPTTAAIPLGFRPYLDGFYDASLDLQMQVYRRSEALFERWERHKDGLSTRAEIAAWQAHLRSAALAAMGGLPPADTPLRPETVGALPGDGFDVERLIFQSLPDVFVTANLYRPHGLRGRNGAVLFVCGHALHAKAYPVYQAVCQRLARNGLLVLAIDPVGQGERLSYLDPSGREMIGAATVEHSYAGYQCWWLGQSIARYFMHDARRAIDYLESLPEVDPARIGITGSSGGGTQTAWMMLLEPRLAAAAPGTFMTRRREYMWTGRVADPEQHLPGGTVAGLDHEDSLIAMAPRPALVLAAEYDILPLEGVLATVSRARRIYRLLGAEENVGVARARCTHQYHPELARAATEFFVRHVGHGDVGAVDHREPSPFPIEPLRCTRSGQVALDRPQSRRIFDLNLSEYQALRSVAPGDDAGDAARDWLRQVVQRHRRPAAEFFPRWLPGPKAGGILVQHGFWRPERDALNAGVLLRPSDGDYTSLLLACFDRGSDELEERRDWLQCRVQQGQAVLVLDVRGTGAVAPRSLAPGAYGLGEESTVFKLTCDLIWLDDSLAAIQLFDVLRAVAFVQADPEMDLRGRSLRIFGSGAGAVRAALAAAIEPRLERVELASPLLNPERVLTERYYAEPLGWSNVRMALLLPGIGQHVTEGHLRTWLAERLVTAS